MLPKVLWNSLLVTPALLSAALFASSSALAADALAATESTDVQLSEIELSDVEATPSASDLLIGDVAPVSVDAEVPTQLAQVSTEEAAPVVEPLAPVVESAPSIDQIAPATTEVPTVTSFDEIMNYSAEAGSLDQVTSISQLSDVQPTDWAFQALQSLVERYGCIAGYPDGTYRGRSFMTRYEFAAGLNACLDRVSELIAAGLADVVTREDLATLQRLQEEFAAELATLRGRVDALEARVSELEANQFSTTTVLRGAAIFSVSDVFGGEDPLDTEGSNETVFQSRVTLNFDTSFTGEDRLRTRLRAGNFRNFNNVPESIPSALGLFSDQSDYSFDTNTENAFELTFFEYYFPIGDSVTAYIEATGASISDIVTSVSSLDSGEQGSLSYFGYNPIYDLVPGTSETSGSGAGLTFQISDSLQLGVGYLAGEANLPGNGEGLFNGNYSAFGQLTFSSGDLTVAATYANAYAGTDVTGVVPIVTNAYGLSAEFGIDDSFFVGGWISYYDHILIKSGDAETWTYAGYLGLRDLGGEGSLLALIVGVPPRTPELDFQGFSFAEDNAALHTELLYRYALSDNISITPGVIWLMDPGNENDNDDIFIGVLRTTLSF